MFLSETEVLARGMRNDWLGANQAAERSAELYADNGKKILITGLVVEGVALADELRVNVTDKLLTPPTCKTITTQASDCHAWTYSNNEAVTDLPLLGGGLFSLLIAAACYKKARQWTLYARDLADRV